MAGAGFGVPNDAGGYAFLVDQDGNTTIGDESSDVFQLTGSAYIAGPLVINDASADVDLRVESSNNANMLVVDAGNDRVGIGTDSPDYTLDVAGNIGVDERIYHNGDADTYMIFTDNRVQFEVGNLKMLGMHKKASAPHQVTVNSNNNNVDFVVNSNNSSTSPILRADASTARVGIGTSSPDGLLHLDNGTSNTELIIEKDAGTSGSIVFHNAGTREAEIAYSTGEEIEVRHHVADKDITLNVVSGSSGMTLATADASTNAFVVNGQFARGTATANLGSGTTSTLEPFDAEAGVILLTVSSVTVNPAVGGHVCTIADGKVAGQILTVVLVTTALDGSGGETDMGVIIFQPANQLNSSETSTVMGAALGGEPLGASFQYIWTGSAWCRLSTNRAGGNV